MRTTIGGLRASYVTMDSMNEFLESSMSAVDPLKNERMFKDENEGKRFESTRDF